MWSSKSDNAKKGDLEDCSCNSDSSTNTSTGSSSSAPATVASASHLKQKQQKNNFDNTATIDNKNSSENNCNISGQTFSGNNLNKIKEKEFENLSSTAATLETHDSGFISGPQTNIFDSEGERSSDEQESSSEQEHHPETKTVNRQLLNIAAAYNDDDEKEKTVLDSGCIDEEFDKDDDDGEYEKEQQKNKEQDIAEVETTSTTSNFSDGSAVGTGQGRAAAATTAATEASEMILKHNVDAGMSEWFCNLSLQNTSTTQQHQETQEHTAEGAIMNNLNEVGQQIAMNSASNTQYDGNINESRQQPAAGNNSTAPLTASNAWEQFYQQNDDGDTPLHLACISGYVDVVAALIRMAPHPCLFNIQNDEAQTPLHLAVLTTQPKILRMLLIAGAEPTVRDRHGNTALHLACISGEEQCVRALIIPISASEINEAHRQYGHRSNDKTVSYLSCARLPSDLEIRNYDGERCVHLAAQGGYIDVLRILVLYGADINAREGKSGRTPLHIAIECCNEDLTNFLLDECLKLNLETATYAGLTAYQVACILNKSQMQNMLEKRGAEPLTPPDSDYDSDMESDLEDSKMYDRFGDPGYFINFNGGNFMTVA